MVMIELACWSACVKNVITWSKNVITYQKSVMLCRWNDPVIREHQFNDSRAKFWWPASFIYVIRAEWSGFSDPWATFEWFASCCKMFRELDFTDSLIYFKCFVQNDRFSVIREWLSDDPVIDFKCMIYSCAHHLVLPYAYMCFEFVWVSNLYVIWSCSFIYIYYL